MKVRIAYTVNVDDEFRRALRVYWNEDGLATRDEIVTHFKAVGAAENDDIMDAYGKWQDEIASR